MTEVAKELDSYLRTLDPTGAAALAQVVRDAIALSKRAYSSSQSVVRMPSSFVEDVLTQDVLNAIRKDLGDEPLERPAQGEFEIREDW